MYRETIINKINAINEIPTLFNVAMEIERLSLNPETTATQVSDVIRLDPAMAGKVLRLANSALYAGSHRIISLSQAISRLGFGEIRRLAVSIAVINSFKNFYVDYERFWIHSITTAYLGMELLKRSNLNISAEKIYSCGLLHDIGVIILDQNFTALYSKVFEIAVKRRSDLQIVENKILGISHAEVGAYLMRKWNLPKDITEVIEFHHTPQNLKQNSNLAKIIYLANFICNNRGIDNGTGFFPDSFYDDIWDSLGLSIEEIPDILEAVQGSVTNAKELIKIGGH
jgi:putative nucleotidyltransferase with HDIG domain